MVEAARRPRRRSCALKFTGWCFQGFEDAKIALIEGIVTGLIEKRPASPRRAKRSRTSFVGSTGARWRRKPAGSLSLPLPESRRPIRIQTIVGTLEGLLADPAKLV